MPYTRISLTKIPREPAFWILFAAAIAFFYRPLFNDETFFFRDLYNHFYPQKKLFAEIVLSGQLPLWDPYRHGGQPFLANMNNSVLYPTNLLYLIASPVSAINIDIILHVLLAAWSSYSLARVLGLNQIASLACGFIYAFSGPSLSIPNVWLYAPFHLPLMLMLWHLYCLERKRRWFVFATLIGMIQVFAGRPEMPAITGVILLLWTLIYPYGKKFKSLLNLLLMEVTIVGLAAIQLIPMIDLLQHSSRGHGINPETFFAWSVHPKRFPELVFPGFFGSVYSLLESDFWGRRFEDLGVPYILSLYFGVPTLLLAIMGGVNKAIDTQFPRRLRVLFLILIALSFLAIGGRYVPAFRELIKFLPGITVFRYPVKFIFLALLPITLLAGYQLNYFMQNAEQRVSRITMAVFWITAFCVAICAAYCLIFPTSAGNLLRSYFGVPALRELRSSILHATAFSFLLALLFSYKAISKRKDITATIAILIGFDLLLAGNAVNQFAPREFLTEIPNLASFIKKEIGDGRLYRSRDYGSVNYKVPSKDILYLDRWRLEMLSNYTATMYDIPVVFHEDYDWLELKQMEDLTRALKKLKWEQRLSVLSASAVRFILTSEKIQMPDLSLIRVINNSSNTPYFLYRNERCAPRVTFVANSKVVSPNEVLNLLTFPTFDPCATVLLKKATIGHGVNVANATVKILNTNSNSSSYQVNTDKPGFVVFSEPYTEGWKMNVDGWDVEPVRANFAFSAAAVPSGKHRVNRVYRPVSVILGSTVSLFVLAVLGIISFVTSKTIPMKETATPILNPGEM